MTARVLIVDDIPTNVRLLEARLTAEYFEVVTATSGQQALEICANSDIDIVLLDVMMPEMDGPTTLRALRAQGHESPVVFITARSQASEQQALVAAGALGVISKPFDPMKLADAVLGYLSR